MNCWRRISSAFLVEGDDLDGCVDLAAQRRLLDRGDHHVGCERQIGGLDREALLIGQRLLRLHRASIEPPDIHGIGDEDLRGVEIESEWAIGGYGYGRKSRGRSRNLLARGVEIGLRGREVLGLLRVDDLLCRAQRRHGGLQILIVMQGLFDQPIEAMRSKHPPPLLREIAAIGEVLGAARGARRPRGARAAVP